MYQSQLKFKKEKNLNIWYKEICLKANIFVYGPVKGQIMLTPFGFAIWKQIKNFFNYEFNIKNISEVALPMLIPDSFFNKEKNHFKGFKPELGKINIIGNKKLKDPLVIRPTSEVLFSFFFKNYLKNYNQLPLKVNQWCSVIRWEKNTKPFFRNSEFWWQEGHTLHSEKQDANKFSEDIWNLYEKFIIKIALLTIYKGEKSQCEKFSGAERTLTIETVLPDGQVLQCATSHFLDQNFTKVYDVKYHSNKNIYSFPYQTSWGISTRIIGAIIMSHGDNFGLVLPSQISPYEIVFTFDINIFFNKKHITTLIKSFRIHIDNRNISAGKKKSEWELKGIPIVFSLTNNKKLFCKVRNLESIEEIKITNFEKFLKNIENKLTTYDKEIYKKNHLFSTKKVKEVNNYKDFKKMLANNHTLLVPFLQNTINEQKIKTETGATLRCIIKKNSDPKIKCFFNNLMIADTFCLFGRAY